ncbi:MAG: DUF1549 domain-containing protein [Planctomycetaceae bacterium]|nr:DUF1549 domain-containing protein [Planctomycetaceae bacterium]
MMGITAACARCHDHKYEPVPTADYYALRGVFESIVRIHPLDEKNQPALSGYEISNDDRKDYQMKRAAIDAKIDAATGKKAKNNNRADVRKICETELVESLSFHPSAPVHTMVVKERGKPVEPYIFLRGEANRPPTQKPLSNENSGRLELANKITNPTNPLTARVFVNRVWGLLMGASTGQLHRRLAFELHHGGHAGTDSRLRWDDNSTHAARLRGTGDEGIGARLPETAALASPSRPGIGTILWQVGLGQLRWA